MYRLAVFSNGGSVKYDKNPSAVPTSVLNELITKECIDSSRLSNQAQLRLGRNGEFTARLVRTPETGTNVAVLFPVSLKVLNDPENLVSDVAKIYTSTNDDPQKFAALVDMRLKNSVVSKTNKPTATKITAPEPAPEPAPAVAPVVAPTLKNAKNVVKKSKKSKKKRTWDGEAEDSDSDVVLDYSETSKTSQQTPIEQLDALDLGSKSQDGGFVVKELSDELGDILSSSPTSAQSESSAPLGFLKKFMGGKKLDKKDLDGVLRAMEDHLVQKNVAKEVATSICEKVAADLVGTSTNSWTTITTTVRESMKRTLSRILTPATSTDLLASIKQRQRHGGRPYVVSVVGVNGVGKSTNLGKLGFWFLQNDFKVMIAACDTFRSGAVEQLKVHVQRLQQLKGRSQGEIELFDQGYGKDAAVIAKRSVEHAEKLGFDVVLIDTAGRRHNDDRLMSSLEKFGDLAKPDKIIMVGEALVGTDSVEQARNFDAAFGKSRKLDFFLISKCDTVGEMLGTLVNVTYTTGVPVLFVGVGQQYTDLRTLSVDWAVSKLLS